LHSLRRNSRHWTFVFLDALAAMACLGATDLDAENIVGYGLIFLLDSMTTIIDSMAMLFNLRTVTVFLFGLFLGIVFIY
jgi:hypothetical protein